MAYGTLLLQAITVLTLGWLIKSYFPSYFSEKGKNLATKEDVGLITAEVEKVRLLYAKDLEEIKSYQNLKVQAYVDFIRGVAGIAIAQQRKDSSKELEFLILLADARARIAVYGSKDVLMGMGIFFEKYGTLTSEHARISLIEAIQKMRKEAVLPDEQVSEGAISQMLFSQSFSD